MPQISESKYLVMAGWNDVPHLSEKTKRELLASTPAHLRDARSKGIPTLGSGAIFPVDEESIKVAPFQIPDFWPRINGLDFGWDHPTAAAGCAWDRDNDIFYVTKGFKKSEAIPAIVAAAVKPWGAWVPVAWPHDGLQHDKGSGEQLAAQYRVAGLNMLKERATHPPAKGEPEGSGGNGVEAGLIDMLERMETGRWKVFSTVTEWFDEFRLYHRKDGRVVKEFDDLISASRYALMMKRKAIVMPVKTVNRDAVFTPLSSTMGY